MLMCQTQRFWEVWCDLVGRPELKADPRFADMPARRANLDALTPIVDAVMEARTSAEWMAFLGGPCRSRRSPTWPTPWTTRSCGGRHA